MADPRNEMSTIKTANKRWHEPAFSLLAVAFFTAALLTPQSAGDGTPDAQANPSPLNNINNINWPQQAINNYAINPSQPATPINTHYFYYLAMLFAGYYLVNKLFDVLLSESEEENKLTQLHFNTLLNATTLIALKKEFQVQPFSNSLMSLIFNSVYADYNKIKATDAPDISLTATLNKKLPALPTTNPTLNINNIIWSHGKFANTRFYSTFYLPAAATYSQQLNSAGFWGNLTKATQKIKEKASAS